MPLKIVPEAVVQKVVTWPLVLDAVRAAFVAAADGSGHVFPVVIGRGSEEGTVFGGKAGLLASAGGEEPGMVGIKVGSYWPANRGLGLAAHGSTTLLMHDLTGFPKALVNAHHLNGMRTAAANAVATCALARPDASTLVVFGAGGQALFEVEAVCQVRRITRVLVVNRSADSAQRFAAELREKAGRRKLQPQTLLDAGIADQASSPGPLDIQVAPCADEAVREADVLVTVTPARTGDGDAPLFSAAHLKPGAHVSAMGADGPGKGELPLAELLANDAFQCRLFADHPPQSERVGEFQHLTPAAMQSVVAIGDVLRGAAQGRADASDVTVFDSSGISLQDVAAATAVLEQAELRGLCHTIDF